LAARQYGLVTRGQLIELGLTRGAIEHRIKIGRLIVVHRGVYAVGHRRTEPLAVAAAAVLTGGPGAVLSHSSAAFLWGLMKHWQEPAEITLAVDRRRAGIRVHISRALTRRDIRHHWGMRVTSPARTLLDIAPGLTDLALARAVNDARHNRHLYLADLSELLERQPTHPGARTLRPFVERATGPTRSEFEDRFAEIAKRYRLPGYEVNVDVAGWRVDVLFPVQRVIVELDGWEFHGDRGSFESDRERDAATLAFGYVTVRVTWECLNQTPDREVARLTQILGARPGA
jgi:very-short-patch-repair endonuclease